MGQWERGLVVIITITTGQTADPRPAEATGEARVAAQKSSPKGKKRGNQM